MTFNQCNREVAVTVLSKYKALKERGDTNKHNDQELFDFAYKLVWTHDLITTLTLKQKLGLK